jgi:CheY-like chemotaxis protein
MAKKRILVVDDEPVVLDLAGRMLEHLGYEAELRTEGQGALERFLCDPVEIDLVISDIRMPGMTGDELARRIHRIRPDMPIIFCSGYDGSGDIVKAGVEGGHTILTKPFRIKELEAALNQALGHQTALATST